MSAMTRLGTNQHAVDDWRDLEYPVGKSLTRVSPGIYLARTVDRRVIDCYKRRSLVLHFDLFESDEPTSNVIARVPGYYRLPARQGKPISATSKLARLFDVVLGPRTYRLDRLPMNALRHKLLHVEVGDCRTSSTQDDEGRHRGLHDSCVYSVVRSVLDRVA